MKLHNLLHYYVIIIKQKTILIKGTTIKSKILEFIKMLRVIYINIKYLTEMNMQ